MLTVYIADDEDIVRQGLKKIINWRELGFEVCGEANNGLTAYNDIGTMNPDLVLLDIQMPKLQGLDLAGQLREDGFTGRIIILSGYSEFKYAQAAIKCHVDFYLTKPIEEEDLYKAVINIRQILQKKKLHTEHLSYYQEKAKRKILEEMIRNERKSLASFEYSLGDLNLQTDLYQILIIGALEPSSEPFADFCSHLNIPVTSNYIEQLKIESLEVILLKGEFIIGRFYAFKDRYTNEKNTSYFINAGNVVTGINDIYYSYHEALAIHERRFFFEEQSFIADSDDLPAPSDLKVMFTAEHSRQFGQSFYEHIKLHKIRESKHQIEELQAKLLNSGNSAEFIKSFLTGMYQYIVHAFQKDYGGNGLDFLTNAEIIQQIHNYDVLKDILNFISNEIIRMIGAISNFSSEHIVDDIIDYIKHHYSEDIKLKILAPKFGYNGSYLGKIFNKNVGMSFNDYLHSIRTEKAKGLLLDERYKVYEVSQKVGYKNVDYFHLKFKNYNGCTPNEFRSKRNIHVD